MEILQARINDLSNELLGLDAHGQPLAGAKAGAQGDRTVFGKLLTCVVPFLTRTSSTVDGRPVLTFWGFIHAGAERSRQPLHCLYPRTPKAAEPVMPPPPIEPPPLAPAAPVPPLAVQPSRPSRWRRWWWLLPLLLLLLLLLFGLRSCGIPALGIPPLSVPALDGQLPTLNPGQTVAPVLPAGTLSAMPTTGAGVGAVPSEPVAPAGVGAIKLPRPSQRPPRPKRLPSQVRHPRPKAVRPRPASRPPPATRRHLHRLNWRKSPRPTPNRIC